MNFSTKTRNVLLFLCALVCCMAVDLSAKSHKRHHKKQEQRHKKKNPKKNNAANYASFFSAAGFLDSLGTEPLSPENEAFIRQIHDEIGLAGKPLDIRKMNETAIAEVGRENAFVIGLFDVMYISEEWFNELTVPERRFLIGHECAHLLKRHHVKSMATQLVLGLLMGRVGLGSMKILPDAAKLLIVSAVSRGCEKEADSIAAKKLHCAAGGVALFERMNDKEFEGVPRGKFSKFLRKIDNWVEKLVRSHPTHEQRVSYLRKLAREQERLAH